MTDADKRQFAEAYQRLAIAHREKDTDVISLAVYFDALRTLEIEFIEAAAERLITAQRFPKPGEWKRMAIAVEHEQREAQRAFLRRLPSPLCTECSDTGFRPCADNRVERCPCQAVRRQELLGRRAWPALPEASTS